MAMALDESRDTAEVIKINEFEFLVEKDLLEKAKPIKVDFVVTGFKIDCSLDFGPPATACTSCSTSGGCG